MTTIDLDQLIKGDRKTLAKAITLIESKLESDQVQSQEIIEKILPKTGSSYRIGISGVPGVGKSTFIEALGLHLINNKQSNVAVLAVDPSSPLSGGSILGDKTRMETLSQSESAFIRPTPASGFLGGVAQKTRETILLCEAAGYKHILIETVGVGQSEYQVANLVDFFLVLMLPNAGDELQGIKKGILELAHAIVINKADGDNITAANNAKNQYLSAIQLFAERDFWKVQVETCSALEQTNIIKVWQMIEDFFQQAQKIDWIENTRCQQNTVWMESLIFELFQQRLSNNKVTNDKWQEMKALVKESKATPLKAAMEVIKTLG